jgi:hypothetical protein
LALSRARLKNIAADKVQFSYTFLRIHI